MNSTTIAGPVSMCDRVRGEVARHEGVPPERLDQRLDAVIDTEALNELIAGESATVSFSYCGYDVLVSSAGVVTVDPLDR
ncbi:HalOD1 output domain-containing protein [Salinirubellus sp. GCM10025899]|jgi:hypothetical protein